MIFDMYFVMKYKAATTNTRAAMSSQTAIAEAFDLSDEKESFLYGRIRYMHSGRWPLWRMLAIRRCGERIVELAEYTPRRSRSRRRFALVDWSINPPGLSWQQFPTLRAARQAFAERT